MITKKVYEEIRDGSHMEYILQLGDFIIDGDVADNPEDQWMFYRYKTIHAVPVETYLKDYPMKEVREVGPEYEKIFQILIDNACNSEYWKYLGKYGRKAVENYKKNWMTQILEPKDFDFFYNRIPDDVEKYNIQPIKDDEM